MLNLFVPASGQVEIDAIQRIYDDYSTKSQAARMAAAGIPEKYSDSPFGKVAYPA